MRFDGISWDFMGFDGVSWDLMGIPSGKLTVCYGRSFFKLVNQQTKWQCSIAHRYSLPEGIVLSNHWLVTLSIWESIFGWIIIMSAISGT